MLSFRPHHIRTHPDKNIENGLEVMAKVMAEFLAIAHHNFQSHEWWSLLEFEENHLGEDKNAYSLKAM